MGKWMDMNIEDAQSILHSLYRAVEEHNYKWSKHFLQQAWWSFTCILYGHGCRSKEVVDYDISDFDYDDSELVEFPFAN